jgi:TRAP-type mannitol/chloroaromatic compound transport system substrate-binding protein
LSTSGSTLVLEIDQQLWDRLDGSRRIVLRAAAAAELVAMLAEQAASRALILDALRRRDGVQFNTGQDASRTAAARLAVHRVADAVVAHAAAFDARSARINASYMGYRQAIATGAPIA